MYQGAESEEIMTGRKRHCWECRRRCLVCDSEEPSCKRCISAGATCPGYGSIKPTRLRWVEPGQVVSRNRKTTSSVARSATTKGMGDAKQTATSYQQTIGRVFSRLELNTESCFLAQSVQYFNVCIYGGLLPITQLSENPYVYQISSHLFQLARNSPEFLQFGMVCMTVSHRINQLRHRECTTLAERFYHYRGLALQSLNKILNMSDDYTSDFALAGVLTLMLVDIQYGASLDWRWHLNGLQKMILIRGGFKALAESETLHSLSLSFWFVAVAGNTTCPITDLAMTKVHLDHKDMLLNKYDGSVWVFHLCPGLLFVELIKINHLRHLASKNGSNYNALHKQAYQSLRTIQDFSPAEWAHSKSSSSGEWQLVAGIYHAAVALFCILSLQSASLFPEDAVLAHSCLMYSRNLWRLIGEGVRSPKINRFMLWPLAVLGAQVTRDVNVQSFVCSQLDYLSCTIGTYAPITAKKVLQDFWKSGETRWDACFTRPYAFTMQIAIDVSKIHLRLGTH